MATTRKRTTKAKTEAVTEKVTVEENTNEASAEASVEEKATPEKEVAEIPKKKKNRKVPLDTMIGVTNNVSNTLIYVSKHMVGYSVEWERYGETQYMELSELNAMRSTDPRFFRDNWVILEDTDEYTADEIYSTLGVANYYKHYVTPTTIDELFDKTAPEIESEVAQFSKGMQKTVYARAKALMAAGKFDSIQKLDAIKRASNIVEE